MTSYSSHSRAQSTFSNTSGADTQTSRIFSNNQTTRPSLNDTAYNGSEGHIDDRVNSFELDQEDYQSPASRVASPRPTLGGRLLSSLSNAQPAAAALGRKGSVLHSRAKSLAQYVPKLNANEQPALQQRPQAPNRFLQSFFDGDSAPVRFGPPVSPTKEKEESEFVMEYRSGFTERPRMSPRRQSIAPSITSTPASTKTSWFGRKSAAPTPTKAQQQPQDELATLNINSALFPSGPTDPLNPSSYNDLLLNATHLLSRMQTAYRSKLDYISTIQPEIDAQREEVEETETRNAHLKMQLEDLGRNAAEQDQAMREMARQVQEAKVEAAEAREAAKTIRVVRDEDESRDETPTRRSRKRASAGSASASDSGFESDLDSVLSAPTAAHTAGPASPDHEGQAWEPAQPKASLQRYAGNLRNGAKRAGGADMGEMEALKGENAELRGQVEELQKTIDGCIEFVGMLKA